MKDNEYLEVVSLITSNSLLALFNLIGNTSVILCYVLSKECRSVVGLLLLHLAFCDILAILPLFQDSFDVALDKWPHSGDLSLARDWLCTIVAITSVLGFHAQSFTLCAIAINRFLRITKAQLYSKYINWKLHTWSLVCVWIFAVGLPFGEYISTSTWEQPRVTINGNLSYKTVSYTACSAGSDFIVNVISILVLLVTVTYCYGAIFRYFIASHRAVEQASARGALIPSIWEKAKHLTYHILTVMAFLLSLKVFLVILRFVTGKYTVMVARAVYLANSSINPFLTLVFVHDFNFAIRAMLRCRFPAEVQRDEIINNLQMMHITV